MGATTRRRIGNINDAAREYGTDAARIWALICSGRKIVRTDGREVMIVADADKREGTLWIVEEIEL